MLINFSFGNFRSFREIKSLRMEASQIKELSKSVIEKNSFRLLPVAVLYGANSSGKTNIILAFGVFRSIIMKNIKLNPGENINYDPFILDEYSNKNPTVFEVQFLLEKTIYRYGFEYFRDSIISEWLYEKRISPGAKEHYLFRRERQDFVISSIYFSEGKGKEKSTPENRLFISLVSQLNGQISQQIIKHLGHYNTISGLNEDGYEKLTLDMIEKHLEGYEEASKFFNRLDLGFEEIVVEEKEIPDEIKEKLSTLPLIAREEFHNMKIFETLTTHNIYNTDGNIIDKIKFHAPEKESNGTNKIITLSGPIFNTLRSGKVLFVDELDAKLHPMLTRAIVNLFMDKETNPHGAQLIFTTHDTHLLDTKYLRRDQIWFTEKDKTEASDLYSLLDFKVRNDRDIENDYITGRYGAIPFIK